MMDRRRFLLTSLAGALATPLAAGAQRAKVPVIGVLSPGGPALRPEGQREPFERGLRELGWTPGATIFIEQRFAEGRPDRLPTLAAELVQLKVDLTWPTAPTPSGPRVRPLPRFRSLWRRRVILSGRVTCRTWRARAAT
jgi:putative ABC transport system substrate-binding protein